MFAAASPAVSKAQSSSPSKALSPPSNPTDQWSQTTDFGAGSFANCQYYSGYVFCLSPDGNDFYAPISEYGTAGVLTTGTPEPTTSTRIDGYACGLVGSTLSCVGSSYDLPCCNVWFGTSSNLSTSSGFSTWQSTNSPGDGAGPSIAMGSANCGVWSGYMYCGGESNSTEVGVEESTISSSGFGGWSYVSQAVPNPDSAPTCVVSSGYMYCLIGESGYYWSLNGGTIGTISTTTNFPNSNVASLVCEVFQGDIFCVGGGATTQVYEAPLSPSGIGSWTALSPYPIPISAEACATDGATFVYCGGGQTTGNAYVESAYIYGPGQGTGTGPQESQNFCYANGNYWAFFNGGASWEYESSTNTVSWTPPISIQSAVPTTGSDLGWLSFGCSPASNTVYYAGGDDSASDSHFYYDSGTLGSDGTVSWATESAVATTGNTVETCSTALDSSGDQWVACDTLQSGILHVEVYQDVSGAWTKIADLALSSTLSDYGTELVSLGSGEMALLYQAAGSATGLSITEYISGAWTPPITTGVPLDSLASSATRIGTTVEVCGSHASTVYYTAFNGVSWSPAYSFGSGLNCAISSDGNSIIQVFFQDAAQQALDESTSTNGGSTWEAPDEIGVSISGGFTPGYPVITSAHQSLVGDVQGGTPNYTVALAARSSDSNVVDTISNEGYGFGQEDAYGHVCVANGYDWVFGYLNRNSGYSWASSSNGVTWSDNALTTSVSTVGGFLLSAACSGNTIMYVGTQSPTSGLGFYYRFGTLTNTGTITWTISETFQPVGYPVAEPVLTVDKSGNFWLSMDVNANAGESGESEQVWEFTGSVWSESISVGGLTNPLGQVVALSSGDLGWLYGTEAIVAGMGVDYSDLYYRTYSAGTWSAANETTYAYLGNGGFVATAIGNTAEIAVNIAYGPSGYPDGVGYLSFPYPAGIQGNGFSSGVAVASGSGAIGSVYYQEPSIVTDGIDLYLLYFGAPNGVPSVFMQESTDGGATWGPQTVVSSESANEQIDAYYASSTSSVDVAFWGGSSGDYANSPIVFISPTPNVQQPITATLSGPGNTQTISVFGCGPNPSSLAGNGSPTNVMLSSSCPVTLALPFGYVWESTGTFELGFTTCSTGPCTPISAHYVKEAEATLDPAEEVNLTGSVSWVNVTLFDNANNRLTADSCSGPPCTPNFGGSSFQFNIFLPNFRVVNNTNPDDYCGTSTNASTGAHGCILFAMQAVIEFNANGMCTAKPQGAPSAPPAPVVKNVASFPCTSITSPGSSFGWVLDSSGGLLNSIELQVNGASEDAWTMPQLFNVTGWSGTVNMTDAYAESVFVGNGTSSAFNGSFANFYAGGGFVSYSGAELIHRINCGGCSLGGLYVTGEHSNLEYTVIPGIVASSNQTYDGGVFDSYYVEETGAATNGQYIIGPPDGNFAQLQAASPGTTACVEGEFVIGSPPVNGTVALFGYSGTASSNVTVSVSTGGGSCTSASGWTTIYKGDWTSSSPEWIPVGSSTNIQLIMITVSYSGSGAGGADVFIDSVSAFPGSYAQSLASPHANSAGVTNPSGMLQIPGSSFADIQVTTPGGSQWINASLGTEYSGLLEIFGLSVGGDSTVTVQYSTTGANNSWGTACGPFTWLPGTGNQPQPVSCGSVYEAKYIKINVFYGTAGSNLQVYGLYVA